MIIKYNEIFEKVKDKVLYELEYHVLIKGEGGFIRYPKPLDRQGKINKLIKSGYPVKVAQDLIEPIKQGENYERLKRLINHFETQAQEKGVKGAVRDIRVGIQGQTGTGKTTLVGEFVMHVWDYDPTVEIFYFTPFDFNVSEKLEILRENYRKIDLIIIDNFDAVREGREREYLNLDFETIRVINKLMFKAFDDNKGLMFISNDDLVQSLTLLGAQPLVDRIDRTIVLESNKSYRTGREYRKNAV